MTPRQADTTGAESPAAGASQARRRDTLDLFLSDTRQLFNSMDPAPFRQRDLDPNATAYIVAWAEEASTRQPLRMVLHLRGETTTGAGAARGPEAVRADVRRREQATRGQLKQQFRIGR